MKKNSLIKILTLLPFTTLLEAKETPIESSISILSSIKELKEIDSFVMTPLDMLAPVSFDSIYFLDYSTVIQMLWI